MVVSSFAIGALAVTVFQLGFVDSLLTILFINLLAITPVCFFSAFGPRFGLRQMVLSRFFFGYHGVKISMFLVGRNDKSGTWADQGCLLQLRSSTSLPALAGLPSM